MPLTIEQRRMMTPIYGTDMSKSVSELLTGLRNDLTKVRGQLSDIGFYHPGWEERLQSVEGLLTCGLVTLFYEIEEAKKYESRCGGERAAHEVAKDRETDK